MNARHYVIAAIAILVVLVGFYFTAPVQSWVVPDGCVGCYVHFQRSLSCQTFGVGVVYWQGGLYPECAPSVT